MFRIAGEVQGLETKQFKYIRGQSQNTFTIPTFCLFVSKYNRKNIKVLHSNLLVKFWWGNLRERDHWGDQDIDGRIIVRWILRKWEGVVGTGWGWLRIGTGGGRL